MKHLAIIAVLLVCMTTFVPAGSAGSAYVIEALNMSVEIPDGWTVLIPDSYENDEEIYLLGLDANKLNQYQTDNNIYLNAFTADPLKEIAISMTTSNAGETLFDLGSCGEDERSLYMDSYGDALSEQAKEVNITSYLHPQAYFVVSDFSQKREDNALIDTRSFHTIINGQTVSVTLHSYSGELSAADLKTLEGIVSSIRFTKHDIKPSIDLLTVFILGISGVLIAGALTLFVHITRKPRLRGSESTSPKNA